MKRIQKDDGDGSREMSLDSGQQASLLDQNRVPSRQQQVQQQQNQDGVYYYAPLTAADDVVVVVKEDSHEEGTLSPTPKTADGIPSELRLRYRKQHSNNDDSNEDSNEDSNDDDEEEDEDNSGNNNNNNCDCDSTDSMPALVSYLERSFRLQPSLKGSSVGSSAGIDFADDSSSIPSINTIKTFATTESEVATVKTKNFIPGIVTPKKDKRWGECGTTAAAAASTAVASAVAAAITTGSLNNPLADADDVDVIVIPPPMRPQISDFSTVVTEQHGSKHLEDSKPSPKPQKQDCND
ncbi:hypothetical protein IV203_025680 [Nitzschia inconspicua]|uniref:Uncharacterized protein n=1 Tax=Nitzschia inconspicua TaxID=303405 RepID=A0A9K3LGJ6_9STRA|nr:hypothetical protein IV203_025680 [Nitzschia inconspicua]